MDFPSARPARFLQTCVGSSATPVSLCRTRPPKLQRGRKSPPWKDGGTQLQVVGKKKCPKTKPRGNLPCEKIISGPPNPQPLPSCRQQKPRAEKMSNENIGRLPCRNARKQKWLPSAQKKDVGEGTWRGENSGGKCSQGPATCPSAKKSPRGVGVNCRALLPTFMYETWLGFRSGVLSHVTERN